MIRFILRQYSLCLYNNAVSFFLPSFDTIIIIIDRVPGLCIVCLYTTYNAMTKKSTSNPCSQSLRVCVCLLSLQGDSGGPVQIYHSSVSCMYTIVGVTSFGKVCGTEGVPGK